MRAAAGADETFLFAPENVRIIAFTRKILVKAWVTRESRMPSLAGNWRTGEDDNSEDEEEQNNFGRPEVHPRLRLQEESRKEQGRYSELECSTIRARMMKTHTKSALESRTIGLLEGQEEEETSNDRESGLDKISVQHSYRRKRPWPTLRSGSKNAMMESSLGRLCIRQGFRKPSHIDQLGREVSPAQNPPRLEVFQTIAVTTPFRNFLHVDGGCRQMRRR